MRLKVANAAKEEGCFARSNSSHKLLIFLEYLRIGIYS